MVEDVARDGKFVNPITDSLTPEGAKLSRPCKKGTLTIVCSGTAKTVGQASFLKTDACIHDGFLAMLEIDKGFFPDFIFCQIQKFQAQSERMATHGGTFINLTTGILKDYSRSFPTLPEQRKIADFLTVVDGRIGQLTQKKALLVDYKKGVMQQLFTQAIRFKDDHGNDFPNWEENEFLLIAEKSKAKHNPTTSEEEFPCVELESISQNTGKLLETFNSSDQKSSKNEFLAGEVLFGKLRPYLRKFLHPNFDGVCSSEIWVFRGKTVTNEYLYQLIQTHKFNQAANVSSGSKMPRSDWDFLSATPFEHPTSPDEQTKIADFLSAIDRKIESVDTQITETQTFKRGLLQQMFV